MSNEKEIPYTKEELEKLETLCVPVIRATKENTKILGQWIGSEIDNEKDIPFYRGKVIEGDNFDFKYNKKAVIRTARLLPRTEYPINWIERHTKLTQVRFFHLLTSSYFLDLEQNLFV